MAFDTSSFNFPNEIDQNLRRYLQTFLQSPADFGQTDRMFQTAMSRPSFMLGPGGSFIDPSQMQRTQQTNWLDQRGNIAMQNEQDKMGATDMLNSTGSSIANIANTIPFLMAQNMNAGGFGGGFGGLMGL